MRRRARQARKQQRLNNEVAQSKSANKARVITAIVVGGILLVLIFGAAVFRGSTNTKPVPANNTIINATQTQDAMEQAALNVNENTDFTNPLVVVAKIKDMYRHHPDADCQRDMTQWLQEGKVAVKIEPNLQGDLATKASTDTSGNPILLILSPSDFLTSTKTPVESDILTEKNAALYHEYIHVRNSMNGSMPIITNVNDLTIEQQANYHWNTEYAAYSAQLQFLKAHNAEYLLLFPSEIEKKGEQRAFLDYFFENLKHYPHANLKLYIPYWEKRYKKELDKTSS